MIKIFANVSIVVALLTLYLSVSCFLQSFDEGGATADFYQLGGGLGIMASMTAIVAMAHVLNSAANAH